MSSRRHSLHKEVPHILRRYKKPEIVKRKFYARNFQIRANTVRVIDENGEQLGVLTLAEAVKKAQDQSLDLVAVSLQANPPVTKIVDFAKFLYDQKQRDKRAKQNTKEVDVKELRFGPNIGDHDLEIRANRAKEFLANGDKVKITVQFKGRMITHQDVGRTKVQKLLLGIQDVADIERGPYQEGRNLIVLLQPKKK